MIEAFVRAIEALDVLADCRILVWRPCPVIGGASAGEVGSLFGEVGRSFDGGNARYIPNMISESQQGDRRVQLTTGGPDGKVVMKVVSFSWSPDTPPSPEDYGNTDTPLGTESSDRVAQIAAIWQDSATRTEQNGETH